MEKVIEGVLAEAKAVVAAVEAAPAEVVAAVEAEVTRIEIAVEEKLNIRNIENEFLKTSAEMTRLQAVLSNLQKQFPAYIESLKNKYKVDITKYNFDAVTLGFVRK